MKATPKSKRILVLYWHPGPGELRLAISRHLHALDWSGADHQILYFNTLNGVPRWLGRFKWDVVVFHTTLLCLRWSHLFHKWKWHIRWLNDVKCLKVALPQDEYDHAHILDEWLFELGVHLVFTNFGDKYRRTLYPLMHNRAMFRQCLTGYIDETDAEIVCKRLIDPALRATDIVYRATHLPFWFGTHGRLKHRIAEEVAVRAQAHGLRVDISTRMRDTIVGPAWLEFLAAGRTVIGSESGSSVLDPRGAIKAKLQQLSLLNPDLTFEQANSLMPPGWDQYEFFAISPRHFEAVQTHTCQVLVEGTYDGVLYPRVHYLPVRRDFSNLDEVLETVKDRALMGELTRRAHKDVFESGRYSYRRFARELDDAMQAAAEQANVHIGGSLPASARALWPVTRLFARAVELDRVTRYRVIRVVVTSPLYWCFLRHPLVCAAKAHLAARLILSSRHIRKLVKIFAGDKEIRRTIRLRDLLLDCFMLRVLQQLNAGCVNGLDGVRLAVEWQRSKGAMVLKSYPGDEKTFESAAMRAHSDNWSADSVSPDQIVWDHSAIGQEVLYPVFGSKRVALPVGDNGIYRFRALPHLGRQYRGELALALAPDK